MAKEKDLVELENAKVQISTVLSKYLLRLTFSSMPLTFQCYVSRLYPYIRCTRMYMLSLTLF